MGDIFNNEGYTMTFGCKPSPKDLRDYKIANLSQRNITYPDYFILDNLPQIKNQGSINSCYDKQTEVLTKEGWKFFKNITYDDLLATVNPENGELIFEHPTNIIKEYYDGKMIYGHHQSIDFLVTPNHQMLVRKYNNETRKLEDSYSFVSAEKMGWRCGFKTDFHQKKECSYDKIIFEEEKISNGNVLPYMEIKLEDWVQFLGIYLAEGTALQKGEYYHYRIQLAAVKKREKEYIRQLLDNMGISGKNEQPDRFYIHNKRIWKKLEEYNLIGVKSYDKFVPAFIFDLDEKYIKLFLLGFAMGDGHFYKNGGTIYSTSSSRLADELHRLLLLSGSYNKIFEKDLSKNNAFINGRKINSVHINYIIRTWKTNNLSINRKKHITEIEYKDYVYCAEVPTYHTLVVKRNKSVLLCGNCVAHAMSSILEYHDKSVHTLSTNFIYGIQHKLFNRDSEGMYLSDACKIAKSYGDMLESECKGNTEVPECYEVAEEAFNDTTKLTHSKAHIIESYFNCNSDEEIKYALTTYGPVLISIKWMNNWSFDRNTGYLIERKVDRIEPLGYHAIVLVGWNEDGWICQNSWGKTFGNCGIFVIPYSVTIEEAKGIKDSSVGDDTNSEDIIVPKINFILNYLYKLLNVFINGINSIVRYFIKSKLS